MNKTTPPLKAVSKDTKAKNWCGPTVVSAITGASVPVVKALIKRRRNDDKAVRGTSHGDLEHAFRMLGFKCSVERHIPRDEQVTLAAWLKARTKEQVNATYILCVSFGKAGGGLFSGHWEKGHWVVVRGRKFLDTFTKGQPVNLSDAPHRRKRVTSVMRVWQMEEKKEVASKTLTKLKADAKAQQSDVATIRKIKAKARSEFLKEMARFEGVLEWEREPEFGQSSLRIDPCEGWAYPANWQAIFHSFEEATSELRFFDPEDFERDEETEAA